MIIQLFIYQWKWILRRMMRSFCWILSVYACLWMPAIFAAGDAMAGKEKSATCAACHGADGNSTVAIWPKIAGESEGYLIKQLTEYRKGTQGTRFEPSMYAMTQNLSDQDIADLAA